jgi:nifR3 family TIM-barrel protein
MLNLNGIKLDVPIFQASLSGYSDLPMRSVARQLGAPLTFAGVMLDKAINHPKVRRRSDVVPGDSEHPVGGQIMGTDPDEMTRAALGLQEIGYDVVDLNFACPAPKVLRRQRGGNMLQDPDRVIEIYRRVREVVTRPLMMKLRIGYGTGPESQENFWKICDVVCREGIDGLTVHGRSVLQRYRGKADWTVLGELKRKYPQTTIFGSGDIFDAETVARRLKETGIDGVSIARGAVGNPWIFRETKALLLGQPKPPDPSLKEIGEVLLQHFDLVAEFYHKKKGVAYFRKFSAGYCKRHPERKKAQLALMMAETGDEVRAAVKEWFGVN